MPATIESLAAEASARGGFTDESWQQFCELESQRDEPLMIGIRRRLLENDFRVNDFRGRFKEGAD